MVIHPYLFFSGPGREAFVRYQEIFGGDLQLMTMADAPDSENVPAAQAHLVMHAALTFGEDLLMASDDPTGDGGPVKGMSVNYTTTDGAEAKRVFEALAKGGQVTMPLAETFWSPKFGMCVDEFGVPWMVNVEAPRGGVLTATTTGLKGAGRSRACSCDLTGSLRHRQSGLCGTVPGS